MKAFAILSALALTTPVAAQLPSRAPLTGADVDRVVTVKVGQVVAVDLRAGEGSGPNWRMVPAKGLVATGAPTFSQMSRDAVPPPSDPATHRFYVRVTTPGDHVLTFVNARTFGGTYQPAETATFVLQAK